MSSVTQNSDTKLNIHNTSVQCYLGFAQNIISRLASNSANAKTWCVTLVAGLLALAAGTGENWHLVIKVCYLPVVLFCFIDMYYLFLERFFREKYKEIIATARALSLTEDNLFAFKGPESLLSKAFFKTVKSHSIWPFYLVQVVALTIILFK